MAINSAYPNKLYTPVQLAQLAYNAGFRGEGLINAVAVAMAESSGNSAAYLQDAPGSVDRGLWQINSYWHPSVTNAMAYNPAQNAAAAYQISNGGTNWNPWSTWQNGAAKANLPTATAAVTSLAKSGYKVGLPTGSTKGTSSTSSKTSTKTSSASASATTKILMALNNSLNPNGGIFNLTGIGAAGLFRVGIALFGFALIVIGIIIMSRPMARRIPVVSHSLAAAQAIGAA